VVALELDLGEAPSLWRHVPVEYPPARELADRHYSRQTVGATGIMPPGKRFLFWHESAAGKAVWGVCRNQFLGVWRFRNTIFRNESTILSSEMIIAATDLTYAVWTRRYKQPPRERLTTEIDIEATARRRSKQHPAGYCYLMAGWEFLYELDPGHGRPARAVYGAPLLPDPHVG
jgi:hypothetical protein